MNSCIPESMDEDFFDVHFEFDDEPEVVCQNFKKALVLFGESYKETLGFTEKAKNGECYETEEAEKAFYTLALSYKYCNEFSSMMAEPVVMRWVQNVPNGSMQEYVNAFLQKLFEYSVG